MEELDLQERPGLLSRLTNLFAPKSEEIEAEVVQPEPESRQNVYQLRGAHRYSVSIRPTIICFDDAYAAANGLKRGEQQILNLTATDPVLRQKVVDFMAGVAFAQEANWEEVGEHIYLVAPASAFIEVVPSEGTPPQKFTGSFFSN